MSEDGTPAGIDPVDGADPSAEQDAPAEKWPLGFIILLIAGALYLGMRAVQMLGWLVDWVR